MRAFRQRLRHSLLSLVMLVAIAPICIADDTPAPGSIDKEFDTGSIRTRVAMGGVWPMALQADGKILIAGDFSVYGGYRRSGITRLLANGLVDESFNLGVSAEWVTATAVQSDQRILIAGRFGERSGIARLNPDGSQDPSFETGSGVGTQPWEWVSCLTVQADGRILVGGWFESVNGTDRFDIARLNSDGSIDTEFDPGTDLAIKLRMITALEVQQDGKIMVGGTAFSGSTWSGIARLNSDGSLDATFDPGAGVDGKVQAIALQPDGKIVIGGAFTTFNNSARNSLARLESDGTIDSSFGTGTGVESESTLESPNIKAIALQADSKVIVGGHFTSFDSIARANLARLNSDGTLDPSFDPGNTAGSGQSEFVGDLAIQPDGKVLAGGYFWLNFNLPNIICRVWGD